MSDFRVWPHVDDRGISILDELSIIEILRLDNEEANRELDTIWNVKHQK